MENFRSTVASGIVCLYPDAFVHIISFIVLLVAFLHCIIASLLWNPCLGTNRTTMEVPLQDKRSYRHLTLASNQLRCLLIHDADTDKAALSTSVNVGQFHDGAATPGLAHLTEHAVFLGSHDFPDTSGLDAYLAQRGGSSNAYTDLEVTCYYMDFALDALPDVLARWAAAMGRPLLAAEVLGKEIMAVDSEHAKNQQQDIWRLNQLFRTILGAPAKPGDAPHPYATFGSGNKASLLPEGEDEEARIQHLRQAVADFCQKYYQAQNMTLAVLSNHTLDEMEAYVEKYFASLPHTSHPLPALPPLQPQHALPCIVHVVPIRESKGLHIQWPMRETLSLYRHKPHRILSHLLGHEGPGTLTAILREDCHWLQDLYADDGSTSTSIFNVFSLTLELTDLGWENVNDVVRMVYAYIEAIRDVPPWVHDELRTTGDMSFRFMVGSFLITDGNQIVTNYFVLIPPSSSHLLQSQYDAMSTVSGITPDMLKYPPDLYLSGNYKVFEDYDPTLVKECWDALRVDNMIMMVTAKDYEAKTDQTDPWYGTQYCKANIDNSVWEMWKNPLQKRETADPEEQAKETALQSYLAKLRLPDPNDMVATNFDLITPMSDLFPERDSAPRCLLESDTCQVWYKPDTAFQMPKVNLIFCLETTAAHSESPYASVLASIFCDAVTEFGLEYSYAASMAGLHGHFSNSRHGLTLDVSGYNHKVPVLLQHLVDTIQQTTSRLTPELFERLREKREKNFLQFLVSQPYRHAVNKLDLLIDRPKWDVLKRLECVKEVTLDDLILFAKRSLSRFRLKGLVHGNVTPAEAESLTKVVLDGFQPKPPLFLPELRVSQVAVGDTVYRMAGYNKDEAVSCAISVYQMGSMDLTVNAALSVFNHLISEPAYSILRYVFANPSSVFSFVLYTHTLS